eukprot:PITA_19951
MDHILQRVVGASRISLLDGFSGFNQTLMHPNDQDKTTFTTPWGTFKTYNFCYFASKDDQGCEKPIAFFSNSLRDAPLKYQIMEKQAYALLKAIKDFRVYILYSHVIAYVPNIVVKHILTQEGIEGKRGKWIATILEYDIEIKPTKQIKGQGLAKLMIETNFQALDINQLDNEQEMATP